jgi:hypothetical protein
VAIVTSSLSEVEVEVEVEVEQAFQEIATGQTTSPY